MEFAVGDKVMYPRRGAGKITGMEHQELVDGFEHYYVVEIPGDKLTVRIPMRTAEDLGIRPVMSEAKLDHVLNVLGSKPNRLPSDYKERQGRIEEKLKTGRALLLAEVVRDLTARERLAYLTKRDNDLLTYGRNLLSSEIAMATDCETAEVDAMIDAVLAAPAEGEQHTA